MSNVSKGQSKELLCSKVLEAAGWTIEFRSTRTKFQRIDLGYRPTKEEREMCECGHQKKTHYFSGGGAGLLFLGGASGPCQECAGLSCSQFNHKKLTGWKAAKFDIEAIKDGVILRVSVKNSNTHGNYTEEKANIADYRQHHKLPKIVRTDLWIWHAPRWRGRGKNKHFEQARWEKEMIL